MINGNGVHLPDTTYGGNPINWNCSSDSDDSLQRLKAENAKLWEQIHWLKQGDILHVLTDQEYIDQCEREHLMQVSIDALDKENAKLRELVRDMCKALFSLNLDYCQACPREDACVFVHKSFDCDECAFERDMRDLGIEVDG